jgi:CDP-diacylglycerol--serine O-phosphatidyltransferase
MTNQHSGAIARANEDAPQVSREAELVSPPEETLPRTFGLKDVFTCINLLGGLGAIIFCIHGNVRYAAYSFLLGYLLGDALDGLVARLTQTGNLFGKEFDSISDHLAQCIAPAVIVYTSYQDIVLPAALSGAVPYASDLFAAALAGLIVIMGSIRHARGSVAAGNFPMAYIGLPRTASAFIIVSFLNSKLFIHAPGGEWAGAVLLVLMSAAHVLPLPFRTHHGRALKPYVKMLILGFFVTTIASLIFFREFVFDVTFFWLFGYALTSWMPLEPEERQAFFARAREWALEVRRAR